MPCTYQEVFGPRKVIIGMIHLHPIMPDNQNYKSLKDVLNSALHDAEELLQGGVRHAIVENDGDKPFGIANLGYDFCRIVNVMASVGGIVHRWFPELTLGVQVLNNYGRTPEIVEAIGGKFLRSQYYWERRVDSNGRLIEPNYHEIFETNNGRFVILADIDSKGSTPFDSDYSQEASIEAIIRSKYKPHALITTGTQTGIAPGKEQIDNFRYIVSKYDSEMSTGAGSGVDDKGVGNRLLENANFAVVGTSLKENGKVERNKVKNLLQVLAETYKIAS